MRDFVRTSLFVVLVHTIMIFYSAQTNQITFFDVGQGDAIYIELANKKILVDGGPNYDFVYKIMTHYPCKLNYMLLTHPHADHLVGLNRIIDFCNVTNIIYDPISYNSKVYKSFSEKIKSPLFTSKHFIIGTYSFFNIWPPINFVDKNVNNTSIILFIDNGDFEILLTGDAQEEVYENLDIEFLIEHITPPLDIYKVGHHGSTNGINKEFLLKVKPQKCVISSGVGNKYGHPAKETLDILNEVGCEIYRTDILGDIVFPLK